MSRQFLREVARRVKALRGERTQAEFAAQIGLPQSRVSEWENESGKPTAEAYARLGNEALRRGFFAEGQWFWGQVGFDKQLYLPAVQEEVRELTKLGAEFFRVPFADGGEDPLALRAGLVPNPALTRCLVVDEKTASLAFNLGDVIVLDSSVNSDNTVNKQVFENQAILVEFPSRNERNYEGASKDAARPYREMAWWHWPAEGGLYVGRLRVRPNIGMGPRVSYFSALEPFTEFGPRYAPPSHAGAIIGSYTGPRPPEEPIPNTERAKAREEAVKAYQRVKALWPTVAGRSITREYEEAEEAHRAAQDLERAALNRENEAAEEEAKVKTPAEWRLFDGVRIRGLVIGWIAAPREGGLPKACSI